MNAKVHIDAGICGFQTSAIVTSDDGQHVSFHIQTDCQKIAALRDQLAQHGQLDAYQEILATRGSTILSLARETLTGCCAGCVVPVGLFKAMQVAAGLALPKDIKITISKE